MKKGFTILELLAVIAILTIIASLGINGLNSYRYNQVLKLDTESALSLLNNARVKAQTGEYARDYEIVINTSAKTLTLNLIQADPGDPTITETVTLDSHTTLASTVTGNKITFARFSGSTTNTGNLTLTTANSGFTKSKIINIYPTGLAAVQ